ncbi:MAG: aminoglycoside phosphotransferase family protein [Rickettsiales bacterium]|nr:aminoglycoside phosphotransferase family protein [Rickettsiales bacterium]
MLINTNTATKLIAQQFLQYSHLPIREVEIQGHDNRTFRLGSDMLVRLPSAEIYAAKVAIEQKWLPFLAQNLSVKIPHPIALGQPCDYYPWHWSIYSWIDGVSANSISLDDEALKIIAFELATFLKQLHKINTDNAPHARAHNFFRGAHPSIYDAEARQALAKLNLPDVIWQKALKSKWNKNLVWIHGDLAAGNILLKNNHLAGVIDFGGMAVGDPACDLTIAWTLFKNESRKIFCQNLNLDEDTWSRARGWALWKAAIELVKAESENSPKAKEWSSILNEILL